MANQTQVEQMPSTDWHQIEFPTVTSDNSNERSGTYALKLTDSDSDNKIYFTQSTVSGEYYTLKFYSKVDLGDTLTAKVYDLGAEELSNGSFANGSNWGIGDASIEITGGVARFTSTPKWKAIDQSDIFTVDNNYYIMYDMVSYTSGSVIVGHSSNPSSNSVGRNSLELTMDRTYLGFYAYTNGSTNTFDIDNVSVKEVKQSFTKTTTSGTYNPVELTYKANGSNILVEFYGSDATDVIYIDDLSLTPIRTLTPSTETVSVTANSYTTGKWAGSNAFRVDGGDTLSWTTEGRVRNNSGTFSAQVNMYPYNNYDNDVYLWSIQDVFKLYYDSTNYQWKFAIYDGSSWKTASGSTMSHTSSGYHNVTATWDNTSGCNIYIDDAAGSQYSGTWTAQSLPTNMFLGSHYDGTGQLDLAMDDATIYLNALTASEVASVFS